MSKQNFVISQFYLKSADGTMQLVTFAPANVTELEGRVDNLITETNSLKEKDNEIEDRVDILENKDININWEIK